MSKSIIEYLLEQEQKDGEGKITLTSDQLTELQNRVRHFLNSYEVENKLNASEMAKILGYTPMHYSRFKQVGTFNKVASCLLFFSNFANLRKMTLSEFIINIENKPLKNPEGQLSRGMWDWELDTIEILGKLESTIRRIFTRKTIKESDYNDFSFCKFEIGLSVLILITKLNLNDFKLVVSIVKELSNRKYNKEDIIEDISINDLQEIRKELIKIIKLKNTAD